MNSARFLVAVLIVVGAALAACSGNFGSGTTPPNGLLPSGNLAGINPTPTPTPNSANNIVTYGSLATAQTLPSVGGYGGVITFAVPSPKPSGFADIAIGATLSVVSPSDAPDLNLLTPGKKGKKRERRARALAYLELLPTHDTTLSAYPRIALDVPRDVVTVYRVEELGLALYNAGTKDTKYTLAAALVDEGATPGPGATPVPSAPAVPTLIPLTATPSPSPAASGATPSPRPSGATAPPSGASAAPSVSATLPPQRVTFVATALPLKLVANRPVVFALYALPQETPSPSPAPKAAAAGAAKGAAEASGAPSATGSPSVAGSPEPGASAAAVVEPAPSVSSAAEPPTAAPAAAKT